MRFLRKLGGWVKAGGTWVLRHGPVISSAVLGASFVIPALGPVASAASALLSGSGSASDPELAKLVGELLAGGIALIGVARKLLSKIRK